MLLRSNMDLNDMDEVFIKRQDAVLDQIRKMIIEKGIDAELDSDNFYLNPTTELKFLCLTCNKNFYIPKSMMKYVGWWKCSNHCFTANISLNYTNEEKIEEQKRSEEIKKELEEFPSRNESHEARELKIYLSKKYSAKLEYRECVNPRTGYFLPYDIYIPKYKLYIEVNGSQHYTTHEKYHRGKETLANQKYKDSIKRKHAEENGFFIEIKISDFKRIWDIENYPVKEIIDSIESRINEIKKDLEK